MHYSHLIPLFALAFATPAVADNIPYMIVETTQGSLTSYEISKVEAIRFSGADFADAVKCDGVVRRIYFSSESLETTNIDGVESTVRISAFPNPVSGTLIIKGVEPDASISIYDLNGRKALSGNGNKVDVSPLPAATYVLKVGSEALKFIKN